MIKYRLIGNDKSGIKILPKNYKKWFSNSIYDGDLYQMYEDGFSKIFFLFGKYMQDRFGKERVKHFSTKYKFEFYFPYFMVAQWRRKPFSIVINFNYLQYMNKSFFNHISKSHDFEDLKDFVKNMIDEYFFYIDTFLTILEDKWEEKMKGYDKKYLNIFRKLVLDELKSLEVVTLDNLSVTMDIHFDNPYIKNMFFNVVKNIEKDHYKTMTVSDETIFFYPYNRNLQIIDKSIPKLRFYDKQKDTVYKYYKKKEGIKKVSVSDYSSESDKFRVFEEIDAYSQKKATLEHDFNESIGFLNNTIRFEVDFGKKSFKQKFGKVNFFDFHLDNEAIIKEYLSELLDMQSSDLVEVIFYDQVTKEKKLARIKNINKFEASGDILNYYNLVIKHSELLNLINFKMIEYKDGKYNDTYFNRHPNTINSQIMELRRDGILRGKGKNIVLNQPYGSLLDVFNHFYIYNLLTSKGNASSEARS